MQRVQLRAAGWTAGAAILLLTGLLALWPLVAGPAAGQRAPAPPFVPLPPLGWAAALAYLLVSTVLLVRGVRRRRLRRFGPANAVTAVRSALVGVVTGLVAASFAAAVPAALLAGLVAPALALDAVDGWVARRTGSTSELGARFDMEVDAFLLLVLSIAVAPALGLWVLAIGALRYTFVAVGWALPWLRRTLPHRYWRKVVTAVAGIALAVAVSGLLPGVDALLVGTALLLLVESFGRDVVWLVRRRREWAGVVAMAPVPVPRVTAGSGAPDALP